MINEEKLQDLQVQLNAFLKEWGDQNDMEFRNLQFKYNQLTCKISLEARSTDINVDEVQIDMFAKTNYGIDKAYGKTVYVNKMAMTICGFDSKARKYKVIVKDKDGKRYGAASDVLTQLWEI